MTATDGPWADHDVDIWRDAKALCIRAAALGWPAPPTGSTHSDRVRAGVGRPEGYRPRSSALGRLRYTGGTWAPLAGAFHLQPSRQGRGARSAWLRGHDRSEAPSEGQRRGRAGQIVAVTSYFRVMVDLSEAFPRLGPGGPVSWDDLDQTFAAVRDSDAQDLEVEYGTAGWYDTSAAPYPRPATPVDAPRPAAPPVVTAVRGLWLATYNPAGWFDEVTGRSHSDVYDHGIFPWAHPEQAVATGNWWLSTDATPANRPAIESITVGDLVVVQRSDPTEQKHLRDPRDGATSVLVGVAIAGSAESWVDATSGRWETRVNLVPAAFFSWAIPRTTARRRGRLRGPSFRNRPQLPDGTGPVGFTLSAVTGSDVSELLAVCGIHPDALAEPDLAVVASRLRATAHGNEELWRYRYDHVFRNSVRVAHEQAAVAACHAWAKGQDWQVRRSAEREPDAGFDLRFADLTGRIVRIEVKGYATRDLAQVHLQPSQAREARAAAASGVCDWLLYAVLGVDSDTPDEHILSAAEVATLLDSGGIQVRQLPAPVAAPL